MSDIPIVNFMTDKEKILIQFGKNLKEARNLKGLSQEALALSLEFDRTYISMLERGKRNPSLFTIHKIASYLEIKTSSLV
jgi:transcriptional regulator with XRE-family HTH domain